MKALTPEQHYLLKSFQADPARRAILKSMLVLGAGGASMLKLADALAAASDQDVAQLTIMSQPGILVQVLQELSNPQFNKSYPNTRIQLEASSNAAAYPRMLAQRSRPVVSGVMCNDIFAQRGIADKMWEKFDPALMTGAANVPAEIMTPGGYGITFQIAPYGIMYNPDRVQAPKSWTDLYDPKYAGRVSMWDSYFDAYVMAGVAAGKGPSVEEGIKAWAPHRKNIGAWVTSPIAEADLVHRGEVWLAPHWGSYAELARSQGKNVAFVIPEEGAVQWSCHMQLCTGFSEPVSRLTQIYMNTWLSDELQRAFMEKGFFSPATRTVQIPDTLKSPALITADDAAKNLIRPDFVSIGQQIPKLKALIDRTLKG
ncbi:extracellular solute-binding protein [Orrella sp. JC864]|uniref:ABC transporter substrate-binding protein n=1 Tax=Orrella sp. JC864 TaxID=3120298 RepID=UPI00300ADAA3